MQLLLYAITIAAGVGLAANTLVALTAHTIVISRVNNDVMLLASSLVAACANSGV